MMLLLDQNKFKIVVKLLTLTCRQVIKIKSDNQCLWSPIQIVQDTDLETLKMICSLICSFKES